MSITVHILLSAMRAVKKTGLIKGPDTDVDENLRKAREYNRRHPYKEPSDRKATYRTIHEGGYPCLVIRQRHTPPSGKAILFLHGGFLAMQLLTWINRNNADEENERIEMPQLLIMNSPFGYPKTNEEWTLARELEKTDVMLPFGAFRYMCDWREELTVSAMNSIPKST